MIIQKLRKSKGFTLIEVLIVLAIIGILATAIIPMLTGRNRPAVSDVGMVSDVIR